MANLMFHGISHAWDDIGQLFSRTIGNHCRHVLELSPENRRCLMRSDHTMFHSCSVSPAEPRKTLAVHLIACVVA